MRLSIQLLTISLLFSNVSCASIGVRTGAHGDNRCPIYPATINDIGTVSYAVAMPFRSSLDPTFGPDAQDGLVYLFAPLAIIDFPLAVAVDTVLLPYDIHKLSKKHRVGSGLIPSESQEQSKRNEPDESNPSKNDRKEQLD